MSNQATSPQQSQGTIKAYPTKDLFISMLIRDLSLRDAIGDLVDNSVDGARAISPKNLSNLEIEINVTPTKFHIKDNCGGISVDVARNYAFRFGRNKDTPSSPGSVGQFGIGMKRALFKLGSYFEIKSKSKDSWFELEVDVIKWQNEEAWEFSFKRYQENLNKNFSLKERGTEITVTNLKSDVKNQFSDNNFIKRLHTEIELENLYNLHKGLKIKVNGSSLKARKLELLQSDEFKPAYWSGKIIEEVDVEIYAGVSEANLDEGGWYIFCNGRLIVGPEQTEVTGWTGGRMDGGPKYHNQFNRFRGYVFFTAEDSSLLPWNTTKNGLDMDSPTYKAVRQRMIQMMKPVITFLNKMKEEREADTPVQERYLEFKVNEAKSVSINELAPKDTSEVFVFPEPPPRENKKEGDYKISYSKPKEQVDKVKKKLKVSSMREVGEKTFDYYFDSEIE